MTVILRLICSAGPQPTLMLLGTATVVLKGVHLLRIMGNAGTFQRSVRQICTDTEIVYHVVYLILCFLGLSTHPFFFSVFLFDVVYREETLLNVIRSVTRNGRSIVLTAVLALILVYMFSIIGYFSFMSLSMFHIEIILFLPQETDKKVEMVVISNRLVESPKLSSPPSTAGPPTWSVS
jgi:hypothetical protein